MFFWFVRDFWAGGGRNRKWKRVNRKSLRLVLADGDTVLREVGFYLRDGVLAEVEDGGGEGGVGFAFFEDVEHVFRGACAAGGDDGDVDFGGDGGGHLAVVAGLHAVGVHDVENDFAGTEAFRFFGPGDDVDAGVDAAAVDEDVPAFFAVNGDAVGVDAEDGGAAAELAGDFGDELGAFDGGGVDGDFFRAGLDERGGVIEGANAPPLL